MKPLKWSRSGPRRLENSVLSFVMFRGFVRALNQYRSLVLLLKAGQWEDALVLARSLYELNVNLSEIASDSSQEEKARTFSAFGKFQQLRLLQMRVEDELLDERAKAPRSAEAIACEQKLADLATMLERDFAQFRATKGKRKWQDSWSGVSAETLAQRLAQQTGAQKGQHDYWVFRLASLFTHNAPGALLFAAPRISKPQIGKRSSWISRKRETKAYDFFSARLLSASSTLWEWQAASLPATSVSGSTNSLCRYSTNSNG